ncbi:hypothetical protein R1flu_021628 [Riccia fluitans]|uniref:DUF659 domain-containing protein n=1 Tax=Riccia fluitans TaxID=41844 RepID=A0ABD1ZQA7_9MARC
MESISRALDEEEREIESAFPSSIRGEPSSAYAGGPQGSDARPPTSNFSSPSSVANVGTHSDNNLVFSQTLPQHSVQPPFRRTRQLPLPPMLDAVDREKADRLWAMAQAIMGLPFRTFSHPAFHEAYRFSSQFPRYKLPSEKRLRTTLLDVNYQVVKEETEKKMFNWMVWDKATISCDRWTNVNGRPKMNIMTTRHA